MIKTVKKIDLQDNEIWQDICICDRCKKILAPEDLVYETKWIAWHPVKMEAGHLYGFNPDANPVKHLCEECYPKVDAFINGNYIPESESDTTPSYTSKLTTFAERVAKIKKMYRNESTEALREHRDSFMCTVEGAAAIDEILKERANF